MKKLMSLALAGIISLTMATSGTISAGAGSDVVASSTAVEESSSVPADGASDGMAEDVTSEAVPAVPPQTPDTEITDTVPATSGAVKDDMKNEEDAVKMPEDIEPGTNGADVPSDGAAENEAAAAQAVDKSIDTESAQEEALVSVSDEYAWLLVSNQAESMMGHVDITYDSTCTEPVAVFILADYAAEDEEVSYQVLWDTINAEVERLAAAGTAAAWCNYADGAITLFV